MHIYGKITIFLEQCVLIKWPKHVLSKMLCLVWAFAIFELNAKSNNLTIFITIIGINMLHSSSPRLLTSYLIIFGFLLLSSFFILIKLGVWELVCHKVSTTTWIVNRVAHCWDKVVLGTICFNDGKPLWIKIKVIELS